MNQSSEPWEEWNRVLEKVSKGLGVLDDRERTIFLVNRFLCDADLGGLSSALYNLSPDLGEGWTELRATSDAFREIGCSPAAGMLDELAGLLETQVTTQSKTWDEFLNVTVSNEQFHQFEANFQAADSELWDELERYTRSGPI